VNKRLDAMAAGEEGSVDAFESPEAPDAQRLQTLGVVPGARLRLEQTRPAFVVTVEENVVAMEASLAHGIFIRCS
jgi:Fe2+ transport system protein FeoA